MAPRIFVFVIGSFEQTCYTEMLQMRRRQLEHLGIPHLFLLDGVKPADFELGPHDLWIDKNPDFDPKAMNPHMTVKFLKGLRTIDVNSYDYIVRVNASTYIQFSALFSLLVSWPRAAVAGGYLLTQGISALRLDRFQFVSGMCMVFSSDVAQRLQELPLDLDTYKKSYDDVILSFIIKDVVKSWIHVPFVFYTGDILRLPQKVEGPFHRVRHTDRDNDSIVWHELLRLGDGLKLIETNKR
jgi:hypothetical protein